MQNIVNYNSYTIKDHSAFYAPMGNGKIALIDARDIAKVAFHVLTDDGHENKAYYMSGPSAISYREIADILSSVTSKSIKYVDVPADVARQSMLETGMPAVIVDALLELNHINKLGYTAEVSNTVEEITGQKKQLHSKRLPKIIRMRLFDNIFCRLPLSFFDQSQNGATRLAYYTRKKINTAESPPSRL